MSKEWSLFPGLHHLIGVGRCFILSSALASPSFPYVVALPVCSSAGRSAEKKD